MSVLNLANAPVPDSKPRVLADLKGVLYREYVLLTRNRVNLLLSSVPAFVYLLLLSASLGNMVGSVNYRGVEVGYLVFSLPTVLMTSVLGSSVNSSVSLFQEDTSHMVLELWSYPLRRATYIGGKLVAALSLNLVQACLALGVGMLIYRYPIGVANLLALLLASVTVAVAFNCLYMLAATAIRDFRTFNIAINLSVLILLFSSPSFYSESAMPVALRWISKVNPVTYGLRAMREATIFGLGEAWPWMLGLTVFAAAGYFWVAVALLRRARNIL